MSVPQTSTPRVMPRSRAELLLRGDGGERVEEAVAGRDVQRDDGVRVVVQAPAEGEDDFAEGRDGDADDHLRRRDGRMADDEEEERRRRNAEGELHRQSVAVEEKNERHEPRRRDQDHEEATFHLLTRPAAVRMLGTLRGSVRERRCGVSPRHARRRGVVLPDHAYLFAAIDEIQQREGIRGNLFEIGVHHGKTAIFLARMRRDGELLGVCDVFEQQELNRDRSGEGSRELFENNMRAFGGPARVFAKPSSELTADDTTTNCRFFHIDGGHRPEDVMTDLDTASRALHADGIVAVDDLFNPSWPGVSEGVYRFLAARPEVFAPILIGGNKVFFARPEARYALDDLGSFVDTRAFRFEPKEWLGRHVMTAVRVSWVDLDPQGAAKLH